MIRYLKGKPMGRTDRGVIVLSNDIGYEVELPATTRRLYAGKPEEEEVELYISYQATQQQPVPRLFGFDRELERDFFEELIKVSKIGGKAALDAMSIPVPQIAKAIVEGDAKTIKALKGIGQKKADMIVAELKSKVAKYALLREDAVAVSDEQPDFRAEVRDTLVKQLQFKPQEAGRLIEQAMNKNPSIESAEDLFDEVLRLNR